VFGGVESEFGGADGLSAGLDDVEEGGTDAEVLEVRIDGELLEMRVAWSVVVFADRISDAGRDDDGGADDIVDGCCGAGEVAFAGFDAISGDCIILVGGEIAHSLIGEWFVGAVEDCGEIGNGVG